MTIHYEELQALQKPLTKLQRYGAPVTLAVILAGAAGYATEKALTAPPPVAQQTPTVDCWRALSGIR